MDSSTLDEVTKHLEGPAETYEWDLSDLATLCHMLLKKRKIRTLRNGFQFFLKVTCKAFLADILQNEK